jgi:hypothetical protein
MGFDPTVSFGVSGTEDLGLRRRVFGIVELAGRMQVGELRELIGFAGAASGNVTDVVLLGLLTGLDRFRLTLVHASATHDEVDEDAEERDDDDPDRPGGLCPPAHVMAANDVAEDHEDQHDPHEEEEEPKHRPQHLAGTEFCCY